MKELWIAFNVDSEDLADFDRVMRRHKLKYECTPPLTDEGYTVCLRAAHAAELMRVLQGSLRPVPVVTLPWKDDARP